jgi:Cu/Ag efflux protein CusF
MKLATIVSVMLAAALAATSVQAADSLAKAADSLVEAAPPIHLKARIIALDAGARTVTLKGEDGIEVTMQVDGKMAGFDKLRVGDKVDVLYKNALLVQAEKVDPAGKGIRERVDAQVTLKGPDGRDSVHQVETLSTVQKIDPAKRLLTLRGVYETQIIRVTPDFDLKDLHVGDTIHAVFVSATAIEVTPQGAVH